MLNVSWKSTFVKPKINWRISLTLIIGICKTKLHSLVAISFSHVVSGCVITSHCLVSITIRLKTRSLTSSRYEGTGLRTREERLGSKTVDFDLGFGGRCFTITKWYSNVSQRWFLQAYNIHMAEKKKKSTLPGTSSQNLIGQPNFSKFSEFPNPSTQKNKNKKANG